MLELFNLCIAHKVSLEQVTEHPSNASIGQLSIAKVWGSAESGSIALFPLWD